MSNVGLFQSIAQDLTGKGQIRLVLQPATAVLLGIRLGMKDLHIGNGSGGLTQCLSQSHVSAFISSGFR